MISFAAAPGTLALCLICATSFGAALEVSA
jgi:hypothetical protein